MPTNIGHFIDGALTPGVSGRTASSYNPATGEQTGVVGLASRAETDAAVAAARRAFRDGPTRLRCVAPAS